MYREFAIAMLIAAPIIAGAAARFTSMHQSQPASLATERAVDPQTQSVSPISPVAHHQPAPMAMQSAPPPSTDGTSAAPTLMPDATIDPNAVAGASPAMQASPPPPPKPRSQPGTVSAAESF